MKCSCFLTKHIQYFSYQPALSPNNFTCRNIIYFRPRDLLQVNKLIDDIFMIILQLAIHVEIKRVAVFSIIILTSILYFY